MKIKMIFILLIIMQNYFLTAQFCNDTNVVRNFVLPAISGLQGYHGGSTLALPGQSIIEKADAFMDALMEEYPSELGSKEFSNGQIQSSTSSTLISFHQQLQGVRLKGHRIWLKLDSQGHLRSFDVHLVFNVTELSEIANLIANEEEPEKFIALKVNGTWALQEIVEYFDPEVECDDQTPYILHISYPQHICCSDVTVAVGNNALPFLKTSNSNPRLCGVYANMFSNLTAHPAYNFPLFGLGTEGCRETDDYSVGDNRPRYEILMTYYHLNEASHYLEEVIKPYAVQKAGIIDFLVKKNVLFDPFAEGNVPGISITPEVGMNPPSIAFKGIHDNTDCAENFNDYAEDADFIAESAIELMMMENFNVPLIPTFPNEGLFVGTSGFLTWLYMKNKNVQHDFIGNFGGVNSGPNAEVAIDVNLNWNLGQVESNFNVRLRGSVWASTLHAIYEILNETNRDEIIHTLLLNVLKGWQIEHDQFTSAVDFYNEAVIYYESPNSLMTHKELCQIEDIFKNRYNDFDPDAMDDIKFEFLERDYFIKDTYKDQIVEFQTGEDIGAEPNLASLVYDRSPSIWNCLSANCNEHHRPVIGTANYLRVFVSNEGCAWAEIEGTLEVYAAFTALNERWPDDWGGDIDNDGFPNNTYYYHGGQNVIVGKRIGVKSLDDYIDDPEGNGRIYTISWTPWNPFGYKPWAPQLNYLARLVSEDEPFHNAAHGPASVYVQDNNNVARRKHSITLVAQGTPIPPPKPVPISSIIGYRKPITNELFLAFQYLNSTFIHTPENFDSLGTVRLIFQPKFLQTYGQELPEGEHYDWVNDSTLIITGPDFALPLNIDADSLYPLQILYTPNGNFQPVSFRINFADENGCDHGGEYFDVNNDGVVPRSDYNDTSIEGDITGFPNPAYDHFNLNIKGQFEPVQLDVYNIMGQRMKSDYDSQTRSFSLSAWPSGLYLVQVILSNGKSKTIQFVKTQ